MSYQCPVCLQWFSVATVVHTCGGRRAETIDPRDARIALLVEIAEAAREWLDLPKQDLGMVARIHANNAHHDKLAALLARYAEAANEA